jgi:Uma2 family endonuclease
MTIVSRQMPIDRRLRLEEYLIYDDGTDTRYELVDGVLVEVITESTLNISIAIFLIQTFFGMGVNHRRLGIKQTIQTKRDCVRDSAPDSAPDSATVREPDLILHSEGSIRALEGLMQACLKLNEPNPLIVVEVVSPGELGTDNYDRDYKHKPSEYAARGIPEYWLIDPARQVVLIHTLAGREYQATRYIGTQTIASATFPALTLTAVQLLTAGETA